MRIRCTNAWHLDILLVVQILFAISVVCLLAVIGAAAAIVRHVRAAHRHSRTPAPPAPSFTEHLHAAVSYGTPRSARVVPQQTVRGITAKKSWNALSQSVEIHPTAEHDFAHGRRKSPMPAHTGLLSSSDRVDPAYFNKDLGDLTDPSPSRPVRAVSGRRTRSTKRF